MKFEEYVRQTLEKILKGESIEWTIWNVNMAVFTDLIRRGVDLRKARRAMQIFMTEN